MLQAKPNSTLNNVQTVAENLRTITLIIFCDINEICMNLRIDIENMVVRETSKLKQVVRA